MRSAASAMRCLRPAEHANSDRHCAAQRILKRRFQHRPVARRKAWSIEWRQSAEQAERRLAVEVERGKGSLDRRDRALKDRLGHGIALRRMVEHLRREAAIVAGLGVYLELDHVFRIIAEDGEDFLGQRRGGPDAVMSEQSLFKEVAADAAAARLVADLET